MKEIIKLGNSEKHIVFLPGGNIDVRCYLPFLKLLSVNYSISAVNLSELNTKTIESTRSWIENYIDSHKSASIVIAHSFGADLIKNTKSKKISKLILLNSAIYNPKYNRMTVLLKTLFKSILSPFSYPNLFIFYTKANCYLLLNLIMKPKKTIWHISQALKNITSDLVVTSKPKSASMKVIASKNDEYFPNPIRKEFYNIVEGNHEWFMNNMEDSIKLLGL